MIWSVCAAVASDPVMTVSSSPESSMMCPSNCVAAVTSVPATDAERLVFGMNHSQWGEAIGRSWGFPADIVEAIAEHHTGAQHGLSWVVTRARELAASLGIGDGLVPPEPPEPGSEAAMLPIIDDLGGEEEVIRRVDWYSGAFRAA